MAKAHMLLFKGSEWFKGLSPEQMQKVMDEWMAWFNGLVEAGKCAGGHPLENSGTVVSSKNGQIISDGPFAESKEAVGGYFFLTVDTMEEALEIAKKCPGLPHGAVVEVRPVAPQCAIGAELEKAGVHPEMASTHA